MINLLTLSETDDRAQKQSVKPSPHNPPEPSPDSLDLLVPWDIPLECPLSEPVKQQIEDSLRSLLTALQTPSLAQAQAQINQIISTLPKPNTRHAPIQATKTALTPAAVQDYDTYFGITHIQTTHPATHHQDTALALTHGLLTNCAKFTTLCHSTPTLNPHHITQQKQGFISYIHLLTRVFDIENFPNQ